MSEFCADLTDVAKELAADMISGEFKQSELDVTGKKFDAINNLIKERILPLMRTLEGGPSAEGSLRKMYSPEYIEPILRLERSFDAREANLLSKFVRVQEYKRLRESYKTTPVSNNSKLLELRSER
jgi:hypothetical protein